MKKAIGSLVLSLFLFTIGHAETLIYSWRDREGTIHIADDLREVPLPSRGDMRIYRVPSARREQMPAPRPAVRPVAKVKEGGEGHLEGERLEGEMQGGRASITELRERLERLRQERETNRKRMIQKRARGKTVYRERREMERIDGEIELLTDQLRKRGALEPVEGEKSRAGAQ